MAPTKNKTAPEEVPTGEVTDNSYATGNTKGEPIPVTSDNATVEDPIDDKTADTDEQLERDDKEAIDKSNIIDDRTRGAKPVATYREPGDTEGLPEDPEDTGRSAVSTTDQVLRS